MHITILTLFPDMFAGPFDHSIIKRAKEKQQVTIEIINIRLFATDPHHSVDDRPYGGGPGMILRVDVVDRAITATKLKNKNQKSKTILLDPQGKPYTQKKAIQLSGCDHLILVCAHYEGIDERIRDLVDEEISVGDYILTGGEIPTMILIDSIVRLLPGVLTKTDATHSESFTDNLLEYPQYTHPREYKGKRVPNILLEGNHKAIKEWHDDMQQARTKKRRPDLLRGQTDHS